MSWRTVTGALLSVLAGLLAPLAVVAGWAQTLTTDTEQVVARYAPLAQAPEVQQLLTSQLTDAVSAQLPLGQTATVRGLVNRTVSGLTGSDLFSTAWTTSLRLGHGELSALLTGDTGTLAVTDGVVGLRLAPFVDVLKQPLIEAGVPLVDRMPEVTAAIPLLSIDPAIVPAVQAGHRLLVALADWLPWFAAALAVLALWAWPSVRAGLLWLGLSLLGGVTVLWASMAGAGRLVLGRLAEPIVPTARLVLDLTLAPMLAPALTVAVLALVLAFVGAVAERSTTN